MKNYKSIICVVAAVCLLGTAAFCGFRIYHYYAEVDEQTEAFEEIAEMVEQAPTDETVPDDAPVSEGEDVLAKYQELYLQNEDMVGWISIAGTTINYPVMQSRNNPNFYLKHNFEKDYSDLGTPYVQENCDIAESDNLVIYGHHIKGGKMFGALEDYKSKSFYEEHKTIQFDTLTEQTEYEIVAVFKTVAYSSEGFRYYDFVDAENEEEFNSYHLHVVYVPVVEKQILWSKRCKDEALRGTVKETIMQVSRSKKWLSKPAVDKDGKPILQVNGKPVLRKSYSVLQDDFFQHMRAAGYTDVERGERDSTEEHLTVTQFKVAKEKQRLEAVTAELNQKEAQLDDTTQAAEKKKQELKSLQAQTKAATGIAVTVQELESMGKKSFTGNIVLTPDECRTLKNYAVSSFAEKAEKLKYQQKYETAKKDAGVWKKRYEKLLEQAQPYLDAVKLAPERVRAFLNAVLTRGKEKQDIPQERGRKRKESTIDR